MPDKVDPAVKAATSATASAATSANAPGDTKLLKDDETGEMVSKTELKRRQRARATAAKKSEKKSAAPPEQKKVNEALGDLDPRQYYEMRSRQVQGWLADGKFNPYPHKFHIDFDPSSFHEKYNHLAKGETLKGKTEYRLGGRIITMRASGNKLRFYDVQCQGIMIQVMAQFNEAKDQDSFAEVHDRFQRGDIIGVVGFPGRTNPKSRDGGELSIFATEAILLTPCLHQLPSQHYGFKDHDQRFRQRYLDFMINSRVRDTMVTRTKVIKYIERYLDDRGFLQVQTSMLQTQSGGATAKPFITHINEYNTDLFLRIAPELQLKMLLVGSFDRVYEIGRQFRNEGADLTHNPEFTTCEFYQAFADYEDLMNTTEEMMSGLVKHITGSYQTVYHTKPEGDPARQEFHIDWSTPWTRYPMIPTLEAELSKKLGETIKFPPGDQLESDETKEFLKTTAARAGVECTPPLTSARLIDAMVGEFIESKCVNPSFIVGHPRLMSPLAKYHRSEPGLCERFECFVAKKEIANAYTEMNNSFSQIETFMEQAKQKAEGDDEVQILDQVFIDALEYGLPPTGGWGCGIDRIVMFLTDNYSIREVLAFPFMRSEPPKPKVVVVKKTETV